MQGRISGLRLSGMAQPLSPDVVNQRPALPSPPRNPLWHDRNPTIPFTLSTHIIDAAPYRTCPEVKALDEVSGAAYAQLQNSVMEPKARQKFVKENVDFLWKLRREEDARREQEGAPQRFERQLWMCLNRFVRKDLNKSARKSRGLTLFFAHAIGFNKETWEPTILALLNSPSGRDVDEIWVWESVDNGDSALLNQGKLNRLSDWIDGARDTLHFLLHYLPTNITNDELPLHLPRISATEFENRIHHGFRGPESERQVIAVGHSFGGSVCAYAALAYPRLFSGLVVMDPAVIRPGTVNLTPTLTFMAVNAFARRDTWSSREEVRSSFVNSKFFRSWDRDVLELYFEHGVYIEESGMVKLKLHPVYEAVACTNGFMPSNELYNSIPELDEEIHIKWLFPDRKNGGGLAGAEASDETVLRRARNSSKVNVAGASHFIPLERPHEVAREIADVIEITRETVSKM